MRLGESLAAQAASGQRPWADQPRGYTGTERGDAANSGVHFKHRAAADELRELLADGRWHPRSEARVIAKRYGVGVESVIDRAGAYCEQNRMILARAAK